MPYQSKLLTQQVTVLIVAFTLVSTAYVVARVSQQSNLTALKKTHYSTTSQQDIDDFVQHVLTAEAALHRAEVLVSERRYEEALDQIDRQVRGVLLDDQAQSDMRYLEMRIKDGLKVQTEQYRQSMQRRRNEWMSTKGID
tara:strand:- start:38556 stop:38975 length:420 start_codon:yes stop_codon:yes gene_type:complete